ncbi:cytochrome P450 [Xylaria intraflava]|nr:cytochrome P450 [Xylaria intraflava]
MLSNLNSTHFYALSGSFVSCIVVWYAVQRIRYERRIRKIGGVRAYSVGTNPFSGVWRIAGLAIAQAKFEILDYMNQLFENAPPECPNCVEIQVGPQERFFITQDPEHIKTILTTKFSEYGKGPAFHSLWRPFLGDSIFTTDGDQWHESRSLIRPMFIKDRVSDLTTFERWITKLITKLPPSGQTVDIMGLLYRLTLDITTEFLLGASANSLDNPQSEFAYAFNEVQRLQTMMTIVEPFSALVPHRPYEEGIKKINEFVMPYIEQALALPQEELEKFSNSDKHFTFLHSILQRTRNPTVLRDQIVAILLAGRDTTAVTLSWAFYQLCHYPEKYQRLRREILDSVGRHRTPTYEDLKNMTYLRHTLNETLRLYPAVPYNIRTALADTTLPGIPGQPPISVVEGDSVSYSTINMQRRRDLYPPVSEKFADPALFSPERWENWTPRPWQYVPFNGGPRICVGQNFAVTEMAYCLTRIVQKHERLEYRGDWHAQKHKSEIVGMPSQGVPLALYEEELH